MDETKKNNVVEGPRERINKKIKEETNKLKKEITEMIPKLTKELADNKVTVELNDDGINFINMITGKVIKEINFKELRSPKLDFKMCIGLMPIPKYVKYDDPSDIGAFSSIAYKLTQFGCRSCADKDLCLKLREICVFDMLGQPGDGK